jgi:hypothetical protein
MALFGHGAMSAQWSLTGGKRTSRLRALTSENDPKRSLGSGWRQKVALPSTYEFLHFQLSVGLFSPIRAVKWGHLSA